MKPVVSDIPVLISAADIASRVEALAEAIAKDYPDDLMIVALLRGSFVFTADLIRALHALRVRPQVDFMTLSSYGTGTASSGTVHIYRDMAEPVEGRDVLIVDDILESGNTLAYARELIESRGARSVRIAVLLEKPGKRVRDVRADYSGFSIDDHFVVGYGLDYAHYFRELPYIGVVKAG